MADKAEQMYAMWAKRRQRSQGVQKAARNAGRRRNFAKLQTSARSASGSPTAGASASVRSSTTTTTTVPSGRQVPGTNTVSKEVVADEHSPWPRRNGQAAAGEESESSSDETSDSGSNEAEGQVLETSARNKDDEVDQESFPLIQMHLLPHISSELLQKALREIDPLLDSLRSTEEGDDIQSTLYLYAQSQKNAMMSIAAKRKDAVGERAQFKSKSKPRRQSQAAAALLHARHERTTLHKSQCRDRDADDGDYDDGSESDDTARRIREAARILSAGAPSTETWYARRTSVPGGTVDISRPHSYHGPGSPRANNGFSSGRVVQSSQGTRSSTIHEISPRRLAQNPHSREKGSAPRAQHKLRAASDQNWIQQRVQKPFVVSAGIGSLPLKKKKKNAAEAHSHSHAKNERPKYKNYLRSNRNQKQVHRKVDSATSTTASSGATTKGQPPSVPDGSTTSPVAESVDHEVCDEDPRGFDDTSTSAGQSESNSGELGKRPQNILDNAAVPAALACTTTHINADNVPHPSTNSPSRLFEAGDAPVLPADERLQFTSSPAGTTDSPDVDCEVDGNVTAGSSDCSVSVASDQPLLEVQGANEEEFESNDVAVDAAPVLVSSLGVQGGRGLDTLAEMPGAKEDQVSGSVHSGDGVDIVAEGGEAQKQDNGIPNRTNFEGSRVPTATDKGDIGDALKSKNVQNTPNDCRPTIVGKETHMDLASASLPAAHVTASLQSTSKVQSEGLDEIVSGAAGEPLPSERNTACSAEVACYDESAQGHSAAAAIGTVSSQKTPACSTVLVVGPHSADCSSQGDAASTSSSDSFLSDDDHEATATTNENAPDGPGRHRIGTMDATPSESLGSAESSNPHRPKDFAAQDLEAKQEFCQALAEVYPHVGTFFARTRDRYLDPHNYGAAASDEQLASLIASTLSALDVYCEAVVDESAGACHCGNEYLFEVVVPSKRATTAPVIERYLGELGFERLSSMFPLLPEAEQIALRYQSQDLWKSAAIAGSWWNVLWSWSSSALKWNSNVARSLLHWQRFNHFPGNKVLVAKHELQKSLARVQRINKKLHTEFALTSPTFVLPNEYLAFVKAFAKARDEVGKEKNLWILKPSGSSQGRGIQVLNDISGVSYGQTVVLQRYIPNPLLLAGYKFDLRLYVLVTRFQPEVEAFIYADGFARMSSEPYTLDPANLSNKYVHLTNSSVQKKSTLQQQEQGHPLGRADESVVGGSKLSLAYVLSLMREMGHDTQKVWSSIEQLVVKSLVCVNDRKELSTAGKGSKAHRINTDNCFELYGYDVLIDDTLHPWLIEINASPSLECDWPLDHQIKGQLLKDIIALVQPLKVDRRELRSCLRVALDELQRTKGKADLTGGLVRHRTNLYGKKFSSMMKKIFSKPPTASNGAASSPGELPASDDFSPRCTGGTRFMPIAPNTRVYRRIMRIKSNYTHQ